MKDRFYGRIPVEHATALLDYQKKGLTQELIHSLKYRGYKKISSFFGKWLGAELSQHPHYKKVELVLPVPLHKSRLKKRGYNQVSGFGYEIAKALQVPFREDILLKISKTESQVFKERLLRFSTSDTQVFYVKKSKVIAEKHILLVDDIVTTGATLESCATELLKTEGTRISFATIAIA